MTNHDEETEFAGPPDGAPVEMDLSGETPGADSGTTTERDLSGESIGPVGIGPPVVELIEQRRESVRARVAYIAIGGLMAVVAAAFAALWFDAIEQEPLMELLQLVFPALLTLVGTVTGFYYGSETRRD